VQVVVDTFCSLAFAKVYTAKFPVTACDLLHDYRLQGRTPAQALREALGVEELPAFTREEKPEENAAA